MVKVHLLDKKWPHEEHQYYPQYKVPFVSPDTSVLFNCAQNSRTSNCSVFSKSCHKNVIIRQINLVCLIFR